MIHDERLRACDENTDLNTTQPPYRLTACFSVISSLTPEQGIHDASKTELFPRKARVRLWASATEKKLNFLIDLTLEKAYRPVFCVIGKIWCFIRSHFRPHRKCSVTIFLCMPIENWTLPLLGNAEIELQCSQGREDTKLN